MSNPQFFVNDAPELSDVEKRVLARAADLYVRDQQCVCWRPSKIQGPCTVCQTRAIVEKVLR